MQEFFLSRPITVNLSLRFGITSPSGIFDSLMSGMRIRKQVYDLKISDIQQFPVWEFAFDEEGIVGQDEATVRPRPDLEEIIEFTGQLVVSTEFIGADGTVFLGYSTPSITLDLGHTHPVIITKTKQVMFWNGVLKPTTAEVKENYQALNSSAARLFPIKFEVLVPLRGGQNKGNIPGFLYLSDDDFYSMQ